MSIDNSFIPTRKIRDYVDPCNRKLFSGYKLIVTGEKLDCLLTHLTGLRPYPNVVFPCSEHIDEYNGVGEEFYPIFQGNDVLDNSLVELPPEYSVLHYPAPPDHHDIVKIVKIFTHFFLRIYRNAGVTLNSVPLAKHYARSIVLKRSNQFKCDLRQATKNISLSQWIHNLHRYDIPMATILSHCASVLPERYSCTKSYSIVCQEYQTNILNSVVNTDVCEIIGNTNLLTHQHIDHCNKINFVTTKTDYLNTPAIHSYFDKSIVVSFPVALLTDGMVHGRSTRPSLNGVHTHIVRNIVFNE